MAKTPALVDHLNRPIDFAALKAKRQGPTMSGVRSIITGSPADSLDPLRLASILKQAEQGDPLRYLELAEQMEERYPHYLSVLGTRKRAVTRLEITVDAYSDSVEDVAIADFVRDWLKRDSLKAELFDILDAVGKGFSATRINWDTSEGQWLPDTLEWWDPRWIEFDRIDGRTPLLRDEAGGPAQPFAPYEFIWHEHAAKSGLPIRGGLARPVAWAYLFQNFGLKDWVAFAEVYGLPLRLGKYDNGETDDNIRLLMRAVAGVSSDAAAVIPKSMDLEFVDGKQANGGGDLFEKLCEYLDRSTSKVVLGQTATTDAEVGGLGSGKEHGDVREDIRDSDADLLSATVNRDVIKPIVDFNYGRQVGQQGGKRRGYPHIKIGRAETVDVKVMADALEKLVPLGLKVGASSVADKMGFEDPAQGEAILVAPSLAATPATDPNQDPSKAPKADPARKPPTPPVANDPGTTPADKAAAGLLGLLKALSGGAEARAALALAGGGANGDLTDRLAAEALDGWVEVMEPMIAPIEAHLASCASLEEARDRLIEAFELMDAGPLTELLARAGFTAQLAGRAGLDPIGDGA